MDHREADDSIARRLGVIGGEMEAAATEVKPPADVIALATELALLTEEIENEDAQLKVKKARREQLRKIDIPDAMRNLGMVVGNKGSFTFPLGRVQLETRIYCSIVEGEKEQLFRWLRENNLGDLIKETVNASSLAAVVRERRGDELSDLPHTSVYDETAVKLVLSR